MDSKRYKLLWFAISTAIIAGMVYFTGLEKFIDALVKAETVYFLPALIVGMSIFLVFSYTWHQMLDKIGLSIGYFKSVKLFMAGNFLNSITPLGQFGGEPLMAYIISSNSDASYEESFSVVLSADILNAIPAFSLVLGSAAYLFMVGSVQEVILEIVYIAIVVIVLGGGLIYLLWFKSGKIEAFILGMIGSISALTGRGRGLVNAAEKRLKKIEAAFQDIGESPEELLILAVISHIAYILQIVAVTLIMYSVVPADVEIQMRWLYIVLPLSSLAMYSPTPGGSGTIEAALAGLLTLFYPISFTVALTVAILFRLVTYWPGLIAGYVAFNSINMERELG